MRRWKSHRKGSPEFSYGERTRIVRVEKGSSTGVGEYSLGSRLTSKIRRCSSVFRPDVRLYPVPGHDPQITDTVAGRVERQIDRRTVWINGSNVDGLANEKDLVPEGREGSGSGGPETDVFPTVTKTARVNTRCSETYRQRVKWN